MFKTNWYKTSKEITALRKHVLRVDLHTHVGEITDFNNPNDLLSTIKSLISAAIVKGLDVLGVVSHAGPQIGIQARQLVAQDGLDLFIIPAEEYYSADKVRFIIYNMNEQMPQNMIAEQAIVYAHQKGGWVMAINVSKRQLQNFNKIKGTTSAPDAIEIYNASSGGYRDIHTEYPTFISSAAKNSRDLDNLNIFTLIEREEIEGMGLLPTDYGKEYTPQYLQKPQPQLPQQ